MSTAMTEDDVRAFYARYVELINAHRWTEIGEMMADTILYHGQVVTREEGVANFQSITDAVEDYRVEVVKTVFSGHTIGTHAIHRGTPVREWLGFQPTGASIEVEDITTYVVEDGRFVQMSNVWDLAALAEQLSTT
jgi:predicted ester cyclase